MLLYKEYDVPSSPVCIFRHVNLSLFSCGFCSACEVDRVSKEAVPWHPLSYDTGHHLPSVDPDCDLKKAKLDFGSLGCQHVLFYRLFQMPSCNVPLRSENSLPKEKGLEIEYGALPWRDKRTERMENFLILRTVCLQNKRADLFPMSGGV